MWCWHKVVPLKVCRDLASAREYLDSVFVNVWELELSALVLWWRMTHCRQPPFAQCST